MDDFHLLKAIRLLYKGYFNTDQDIGEFSSEFYNAVGELLSGKKLHELKLEKLILNEILPPDEERYEVDS